MGRSSREALGEDLHEGGRFQGAEWDFDGERSGRHCEARRRSTRGPRGGSVKVGGRVQGEKVDWSWSRGAYREISLFIGRQQGPGLETLHSLGGPCFRSVTQGMLGLRAPSGHQALA